MQIGINNKVSPKTRLKLQENLKKPNPVVVQHLDKCYELPEHSREFRELPPILFPYQQEFLQALYESKYQIYVWEKSRRIGATWGIAAYAVLEAVKEDRATDFFYIGTSLAMAREFLENCAYWVRAFNIASSEVGEYFYEDERTDILTLRIHFSSGKKIAALSSKPSSTRGLQGTVMIDEAAFLNNLEEFLKAAISLTIWGAKILVISTHNGVLNAFNELIELIRKGEKKYYLQKTTFKDAVKQGFFKRLCLIKGDPWDKEKEDGWVKGVYQDHGSNASEELDVIPKSESELSIYKSHWFKRVSRDELPKTFDYVAIGWDLASTDKPTSCYTSGVVMAKKKTNFYILDWFYCRKDAKGTQNFIINKIKSLPKTVPVYLELESGSESILWLENSFKPLLPGYIVRGVRPQGSKGVRSLPCAEQAENGNIYVINESWGDEFIKVISQFSGEPGVELISDTADSLSLVFNAVNKGVRSLLGT